MAILVRLVCVRSVIVEGRVERLAECALVPLGPYPRRAERPYFLFGLKSSVLVNCLWSRDGMPSLAQKVFWVFNKQFVLRATI